jgi:hypothetical protein
MFSALSIMHSLRSCSVAGSEVYTAPINNFTVKEQAGKCQQNKMANSHFWVAKRRAVRTAPLTVAVLGRTVWPLDSSCWSRKFAWLVPSTESCHFVTHKSTILRGGASRQFMCPQNSWSEELVETIL